MYIRKSLVTLSIVAPLVFAGVAYAVTVPSDYAQDVKDGTNQVKNDTGAQSQANEVKGDESIEGQVDDGQVQVNETVGDQENNMNDSQQGESHDPQNKTNVNSSSDSGSTTQPTGNTNGSY